MTQLFAEVVPRLQAGFERVRDPARAVAMAAYMRDQFPFIGVPAPQQAVVVREALAGLAKPGRDDLTSVTAMLWGLPEREYQYAAAGLLRRYVRVLDQTSLEPVRVFIVTKSWWDTVDALASHVVGPLVARYPELAPVMDDWVASDNIWLARTAILHQNGFKRETDAERLFRYCQLRCGDTEFFIRKAIGWALREYSKSDGDAVRRFVSEHESDLSGLSKREALLWLNGGRRKGTPS